MTMTEDKPNTSPALSDTELRETIDTMGLLIASVSNRVDDQGLLLEKLTQTAVETRAAAFAAQQATDWERNGEVVTRQVDRVMDANLARFHAADRHVENIRGLSEQTKRVLDTLVWIEKDRMRQREARWRRWWPVMAAAMVVLVMGLGLTLPHFMAGAPRVCNLLGGKSYHDPRRGDALFCAFYEWR